MQQTRKQLKDRFRYSVTEEPSSTVLFFSFAGTHGERSFSGPDSICFFASSVYAFYMESVAKTTYRIINELLYGRKMNSFARRIRSPLSFRRSGASTAAFLLLLDRLHKEVETEKASTTDQHQDPFLLHVLREYRIYQRMSSTGNWERNNDRIILPCSP